MSPMNPATPMLAYNCHKADVMGQAAESPCRFFKCVNNERREKLAILGRTLFKQP